MSLVIWQIAARFGFVRFPLLEEYEHLLEFLTH